MVGKVPWWGKYHGGESLVCRVTCALDFTSVSPYLPRHFKFSLAPEAPNAWKQYFTDFLGRRSVWISPGTALSKVCKVGGNDASGRSSGQVWTSGQMTDEGFCQKLSGAAGS